MNRLVDSAKLAFRGTVQGRRSNKVYIAELIEVDNEGYIVTGWNGPRDGTLTKQPKITIPTSYAAARSAFTELVNKKLYHSKTPYEYDDSFTDTRPASERPVSAPQVAAPPPRSSSRLPQAKPKTESGRKKSEEEAPKKDRFDALEF